MVMQRGLKKISTKKSRKSIPLLIEQPDARNKFQQLRLFNKWELSSVVVEDAGLKPYINLAPQVVPTTYGRYPGRQFWKSKENIAERLMGKLSATGHKGKKHYWTSGRQTGRLLTHYKTVKRALEIIEDKTKANPIQALVKAIEKGSAREGVATIELGGVRYPKSAEVSPQRRVDLALKWMCFGAFVASRKFKQSMSQALAGEIIATMNNEQSKSACLQKKQELERQAQASR